MTLHALPTTQRPHFAPTLSETEARQQARLLKALADETRLRILSLLARYEGQMHVDDIVGCFDLQQSSISHHLRILLSAGLIDFRKQGLYSYYFVCEARLREAQAMMEGIAHER